MTATRRPVDVGDSLVGLSGTVLVIGCDERTGADLEPGLRAHGLEVVTAPDGESGMHAVRRGVHGLVLLDLALPDGGGFDVLADIRQAQPNLPVIVLSALGGVENRVLALDAGAVDCVITPFSAVELVARIRAQLRQSGAARTTLSGAGLEVDLVARTVVCHGVPVHLTTMEFRLLVYLMQRTGITQSRRDILDNVWGQESDAGRNLVDVYVGYLRRKLADGGPGRESPIETVRLRGYRFGTGETDPGSLRRRD